MTLDKLNNLKVNSGVPLSRFVIDLKQDSLKPETKIIKAKNNHNIEEKLEQLAEIDYKKYFKSGKNKTIKSFNNLFDYTRSVYSRNFISAGLAGVQASGIKNDKTGIKRKAKARINKSTKFQKLKAAVPVMGSSKFDQLTLFLLGKLLYIALIKIYFLFYKICYTIGWVIIFILRFIYFLLIALIKPCIKIVKYLFFKSQVAVSGTLNILPAGYQATQSLRMALTAKSFYYFRSAAMAVKKFIIGQRDCLVAYTPRDESRPAGYFKPVLIFAGILFVIVLPVKTFTYYKAINIVKGKVLGASESAMDNLISAGQSAADLNFSQAGQGFENASNNFLSAQNELDEINGLIFALASVLPDKNMQLAAAGKNILRAGESSANAGKNLSLAMASLFSYQENTTGSILENLNFYGNNALTNLTELAGALDEINSDVIPENYQDKFILLKLKTGELNRGLKEFISLTDSLGDFLGASADKRYLLVFQNNSELRASGGFIGSFALIDFSRGQIKNIEVPGGGSYDTDAGLLKKIKSPEPLSLVRADWHFWDANWWPDWPTSARKLAWFYENSDGSTVDGVIGFTPAVIEKLLKAIGPIDLKDKYGLIIDADNFWLEAQTLAEQKPDVTKEPKKIIGDLMNKIIEELPKRLNKDNLVAILKTFEESLADKNILFYFTDKNLEAKADDLGWSGKIKYTASDYLSVINTNIAGGKSDRKIKQEIIHQAKIQPDGSIIDDLTIRRVHEAVKREPFCGVRNVNWVRVYVPLGSELLEANGFKPVDKIFFKESIAGLEDDPDVLAGEGRAQTDELSGTKIYNELGKTVFANWSQLDPGETIEINIKYKLPFKITDKKQPVREELTDQLIAKAGEVLNPEQNSLYSYSLLAQKQPGMNSSTIESKLDLNGGYESIWKYPADLSGGANGWFMAEDFNQDKIIGIIVEEK